MNADGNGDEGTAMNVRQLRVASEIDAAMRPLLHAGKDALTIFVAMGEHMAGFKWLVNTAEPAVMDELCRRHAGLSWYAKLLEAIGEDIQSGAIKAPRR